MRKRVKFYFGRPLVGNIPGKVVKLQIRRGWFSEFTLIFHFVLIFIEYQQKIRHLIEHTLQ